MTGTMVAATGDGDTGGHYMDRDKYRMADALRMAQRCEARAEDKPTGDADRQLLEGAAAMIRGLALRAVGVTRPAHTSNKLAWQHGAAGEDCQRGTQ